MIGTGTIIVSEDFSVLYWNQGGSEWLSNLRKHEQLNIKRNTKANTCGLFESKG